MKKLSGQSIFLIFAVVFSVVVVAFVGVQTNGQRPSKRALTLGDIPFDGKLAYGVLKEICEIGGRVSGSEGMEKQQRMLKSYFTKKGKSTEAKVWLQDFKARDPRDGKTIDMANLVVEWYPERKERILLCCHYDTRPFPDRDPDPAKRKDVFLGANDGASGVGLLAAMAKEMTDLKAECNYGVDFVFFDGEEYVFPDGRGGDLGDYFLGSEHFAKDYVANPPAHTYKYAILVDMVGDASLQIFQEQNSLRNARSLVQSVWRVARKLGVREFIDRPGYEIRDDHLPLIEIAKIPAIDIIDFDYPRPGSRFGRNAAQYWHTTNDKPSNCSALSLAKVGWVIHEWLKAIK